MRTSLLLLLIGCAHQEVLHLKGTLTGGGMSGPYEAVEHVGDGRRKDEYRLGPIEGSSGFDGKASWYLTTNGELMLSDGAEAVALARTETWMVTRGYERKDGASFSSPVTDERGLTRIDAKPEGGIPISLFFDASGLLVETRHRDGELTVITKLGDYREVGGIRTPFTKVIDEGDPRNLLEIRLESAELIDASDQLFARPAQDASKVSFIGGATSTEIPFQLVNNHIYVEAQVDGKPVLLLVDTGGANILTPAAAERLGITSEGKMAATGVGEQKIDLGYARVKTLALGEVRIADPLFAVLELDPLPDVEGLDFDGLVGFEVFHRFAVRIAYPTLRLALIDREAFTAPAAKSVPFQLDDHIPIIAGEIDGVPARISVDTGSRGSISAHSPFTKKHDLVKKYAPRFETVTGWGVGGPLRSWPIRIGKLKMGEHELEGVLGDLYLGDKGAFASPSVDLNLGGSILRRYVVTFDYDARLMYLQPHLDTRDVYDRAGLWIMREGDKLRIADVTATGPAEKAGLAEGDRLLAIDGAPAGSQTVAHWRGVFRGNPGTRIALKTERNGTPRDVELVLEELVP